jgi:hypothetical protein
LGDRLGKSLAEIDQLPFGELALWAAFFEWKEQHKDS